jgi:ubiquinone/menaquinone biosynthesis C-methylase UbiE
MESSKATATRLAAVVRNDDNLLDVGCGVGHYYRSLRRVIEHSFRYTGLDATDYYIERAKEAFAGDANTNFVTGDIFALSFPDRSFDVVLCANVVMHLPSIARPISELCRVARRFVLIRMLVGERSFLIQDVRGVGDEIDDEGKPRLFNWHNIYSRPYISGIVSKLPGVKNLRIEPDSDYDPGAIEAAAAKIVGPGAVNATRMLGGWQVNGYIMQPWCFVEIELAP